MNWANGDCSMYCKQSSCPSCDHHRNKGFSTTENEDRESKTPRKSWCYCQAVSRVRLKKAARRQYLPAVEGVAIPFQGIGTASSVGTSGSAKISDDRVAGIGGRKERRPVWLKGFYMTWYQGMMWTRALEWFDFRHSLPNWEASRIFSLACWK